MKSKSRSELIVIFLINLLIPFIYLSPLLLTPNNSFYSQKEINKVKPYPNMSNSNDLWNFSIEESVSSVSISSDGNWIVAGSTDEKIYLFEKSDPTPLWDYSTGGNVRSVAISSDGNYIVAGSTDNKIYLFNKSSSTPLWDYSTGGNVGSVAISSDGNYIVGGSDNFRVYLFNKSSSTPLWDYSTGGNVRTVAISSDGNYIVGGSYDNRVYLFNNTSSTPLWDYSTGGIVRSVAISSDGNYIVGGGYDNRVYLFNNTSSTPLWDYSTGGNVRSVAISSDGNYIVGGSDDTRIYLFNKSSSTPLWDYSTGGNVRTVAISSDGNYIAGGSDDTRIYLFNISNSIPLWDYSTGGNVRTVAISSDGAYTVLGNLNWDIIFFFNYPLDHLTLINIAGNSDNDGDFNLKWTHFKNADNYSIYYSTRYIVEVNESVSLLKSNITTNFYSVEEFRAGEYYFKIVAYLNTGNFSSNCIYIKIESISPELFNQNFLFVIILITVGILFISSSVGTYYAVRKYKQKKLLFEISKEPAIKSSLELFEEIKEESPFIRNYLDTAYKYEQVPKIKDYIFSRFTSRELQKLDLIELSSHEKKKFIKEIINLEPQEREQLIDEMLKSQEELPN